MGNVVEGRFGQKLEVVYQCVACEAQGFWLDEEGTITCRTCKAKQLPPYEWVESLQAQYKEDE